MRKLCLLFALVLAAVSSVPAQWLSVGVLGGIRLTEGFQYLPDESRTYDMGGSVEFRLPAGFAVEADALYQRVGYSYALIDYAGTPVTAYSYRERGNLSEFPLLGKYYFRPVQSPGSRSLERVRVPDCLSHAEYSPSNAGGVSNLNFRLNVETGAAIAAGIRFQLGPVVLLPQARYTYWGNYKPKASARTNRGQRGSILRQGAVNAQ